MKKFLLGLAIFCSAACTFNCTLTTSGKPNQMVSDDGAGGEDSGFDLDDGGGGEDDGINHNILLMNDSYENTIFGTQSNQELDVIYGVASTEPVCQSINVCM